MYEMSCCVSLLSRRYFEIFVGGDVFAGDSFSLATSRISGKGVLFLKKYFIIFILFFIKQFLLG